MKIELSSDDIAAVLTSQCYGHLGCISSDGRPYVVPITYVYEDGCIYSFSFEGKKIALMRENPEVCFQVEDLSVEDSWKSVMSWGTFEELKGDDRKHVFTLLINRLWEDDDQLGHTMLLPFRESLEALKAAKEDEGTILYRIRINESSGRFEQVDQ